MNRALPLIAGTLFLLGGCTPVPHADFGVPLELEDQSTTPVSTVLEDPKSYDGKQVRLEGEVHSVCARKGCWIRMSPEGADADAPNVFVKFTCPIEGRLIPMEAKGHQAVVEGTLAIETISEADARHLAEEGGKSPEEVSAIVGEQVQIRMKSPAARIVGISPPPPPATAPTTRPTTPTSRPTTRPASSS